MVTNFIKEIQSFNDSFRKGKEMKLDYVKSIVEYALNNQENIKEQLSTLTIAELEKLTYSSYIRKADLIEKVASTMLDNLYFRISGTKTISYIVDFKSGSMKEQQIKKLENALAELTEDKLQQLLKNSKEEYLKEKEQILYPKTIEDFEKAVYHRVLSVEEVRNYEELLADRYLQRNLLKECAAANDVSSNCKYTINKTKDTRNDKDLWVLKFEEKSDDFRELNRQMKSIGGTGYSRYTRGFNFYFDPEEKLNELYGNSTMKSYTEEELPSKIIKIKTLLQEGKIKYLYKVEKVSHIDLLDDLLEECSNNYDNIDKLKYPLTTFKKCDLEVLLKETDNTKNTTMIRNRLKKLLRSNAEDLKTKLVAGDIINLYDKAIYQNIKISIDINKIMQYKMLKDIGITSTVLLRVSLREYYNKILENTNESVESLNEKVKQDKITEVDMIKENLDLNENPGVFTYYLINRPPSIGTQPQGTIKIEAFKEKKFVSEINKDAWGYVTYNHELTKNEMYEYELVKLKSYDEKKADAKQEILLSGVAYNGIKTVKIVADYYKDNMFNVEVVEKGDRYTVNETPFSYDESVEYAVKELFYENDKEEIKQKPLLEVTNTLVHDKQDVLKNKDCTIKELECGQLTLFNLI